MHTILRSLSISYPTTQLKPPPFVSTFISIHTHNFPILIISSPPKLPQTSRNLPQTSLKLTHTQPPTPKTHSTPSPKPTTQIYQYTHAKSSPPAHLILLPHAEITPGSHEVDLFGQLLQFDTCVEELRRVWRHIVAVPPSRLAVVLVGVLVSGGVCGLLWFD